MGAGTHERPPLPSHCSAHCPCPRARPGSPLWPPHHLGAPSVSARRPQGESVHSSLGWSVVRTQVAAPAPTLRPGSGLRSGPEQGQPVVARPLLCGLGSVLCGIHSWWREASFPWTQGPEEKGALPQGWAGWGGCGLSQSGVRGHCYFLSIFPPPDTIVLHEQWAVVTPGICSERTVRLWHLSERKRGTCRTC
uniref:Uncharacterized protein n=1 Tax=Myotis myotis TaxID=51298 RepID=A0A7J7QX32_MYOMY|nr:hypothetical protein mMyoMyo1_011285 [Myotis myotis]